MPNTTAGTRVLPLTLGTSSQPSASKNSLFRTDNYLRDVRVPGDVPGYARLHVGVHLSQENYQRALVVSEPRQNCCRHGNVPGALRLIIPANRSGAGMARHRCLESLESTRRLGKLWNQRGFRRRQLLISSDFSRDRLRCIQAQDGNSISSAPYENALVSGRCLSPAALEISALSKRGPADLLFEVLIQRRLLRDIDHFHPDGHRMVALMKRANNSFLKLVVRWLAVPFGHVNDAGPCKAGFFDDSRRDVRGRRIVRCTAREDQQCQSCPDSRKVSEWLWLRASTRPTRIRHSKDARPVIEIPRGVFVRADALDRLPPLPGRSIDQP
jgi:hypothetical protein